MIENKKAQNLSITTIILIILGVVVLVALILGFTQGWSSLKGWFTSEDTPAYISQCAVACSTMNVDGWCKTDRDTKTPSVVEACKDLVGTKGIDSCTDISDTKCDALDTPEKLVCIDQPGKETDTKAVECLADKCIAENQIAGTDVADGNVCCNIACIV